MLLQDLLAFIKHDWYIIVVFGCILILIRNFLLSLGKKSPPGPFGLPIVGYLPFITKRPDAKFIKLAKRYGEVFSVRLGSQNVVVVNGLESIREVHSKPEFLARPKHSAFALVKPDSPFFVHDVPVWKEQRRFTVQSMKDLGLGRSIIESHIQDEISCFLAVLSKSKGEPLNLLTPLTPSMSNNICALTFGKRYDYEHPERILLDKNLNVGSKIIGQLGIHVFFPWLKRVPFVMRWLNYENGLKAFEENKIILQKEIEEHKSTIDKTNPRDFIDKYLIEMEARRNDSNTNFTDQMMLGVIFDLFGAGSETVRTTISWISYIMASYEHVQRKVYQEIVEVLGPHRSPEILDQKSLPYTHAVILEVMRWQTIVPLGILRLTSEDSTICGFSIHKGTIIVANFWALHHDPELWDEPEKFKPERFLSKDGKTIVKPPHYMPFSMGKRSCPGEAMAHMEVFLYFVSMLQKFEIRLPQGAESSFEAVLATTHGLKNCKIRLLPRN